MFSTPTSKKVMTAVMPGVAQPYTGHTAKGKKVSQIIRNLEVCLQREGAGRKTFLLLVRTG